MTRGTVVHRRWHRPPHPGTPRTGVALTTLVVLLTLATGCGGSGGGDGSAQADRSGQRPGDDRSSGDRDGPSVTTGAEGAGPVTTEGADDAPAPEGSDSGGPPPLDAILLTEQDAPGWEAHATPPDQTDSGCAGRIPQVDQVQERAAVELGRVDEAWGDVRGVFQDVVRFRDQDAAVAFLAAYGTGFADCLRAPGTDLVPTEVAPLDVAGAGLGDGAQGWQVAFDDPHPLTGIVDGLQAVAFRRGHVVVAITTFLPLAADLDLLDLASTVDDRLA